MELGTSHFELGVDLSDINIQDDFDNNPDGFGSLMDVFVQMTENSPPGSPRHASNPGSPGGLMDLGRNSPTKLNGMSVVSLVLFFCINFSPDLGNESCPVLLHIKHILILP